MYQIPVSIFLSIGDARVGIQFEMGVSIILSPELNLNSQHAIQAITLAQKISRDIAFVCMYIPYEARYHEDWENRYYLAEKLETCQTSYADYGHLFDERGQSFICQRMQDVETMIDRLTNPRKYHVEPQPKEARKSPGYVYLLHSEHGYKIGKSKRPNERQVEIGTKLPFEVERIGLIETDDMKKLELSLHQRYADKRLNGEWFNLDQEDVDYIKSLGA